MVEILGTAPELIPDQLATGIGITVNGSGISVVAVGIDPL